LALKLIFSSLEYKTHGIKPSLLWCKVAVFPEADLGVPLITTDSISNTFEIIAPKRERKDKKLLRFLQNIIGKGRMGGRKVEG
jgi:hypothetical protein